MSRWLKREFSTREFFAREFFAREFFAREFFAREFFAREFFARELFTRELLTDARHYQIAALTTLVIFNIGWIDFGARPLNSVLAVGSALATQAICARWVGLPSIDLR